MKRITAIILSLLMIVSLVGCSGTASSTSSESSTSESEQTESEATTESERLQVLVDDGVISQDTLNAIIAYLKVNNIDIAAKAPDGAPDGQAPGSDGEEPPQKPDGEDGGAPEKPEGNGDNAPSKPEGEQGDDGAKPDGEGGTVPEKPEGDGKQPGGDGKGQGSLLIPTDVLQQLLDDEVITQDEYDAIAAYRGSNDGMQGGGFGGGGGVSATDVSYTAANEILSVAEHSNGAYTSDTADENALLIDTTENVVLNDATVTKTGDSDGGDACNFYGLNAAVLAKGGANVTITGGTVTTDADGANAVFSYGGNGGKNGGEGDGTTVNISDTVITTTGDGSGGIMTTGGGVTNAENLTVETSGRSSAAIRTDRGGGTVNVTGGTYTTNGLGSPAIYSTAAIKVSDATLVSNLSEGVCIEGKNSIELTNCDLTANNTQCNGNATFLDSIMIYQSMSGDADSGTSSFTMTGGSLTSRSGHVFHVTNTNAVITLNGVAITNEDADGVLLSVCDDGWSGAGNIATLNAVSQTLEGIVLVGSDSELTLNLTDGSAFTGSISGDISDSRGKNVSKETGTVSVTLDTTSTWTLTGDSYISSFDGDASQVISNGYTLYVNGVALEGTK